MFLITDYEASNDNQYEHTTKPGLGLGKNFGISFSNKGFLEKSATTTIAITTTKPPVPIAVGWKNDIATRQSNIASLIRDKFGV